MVASAEVASADPDLAVPEVLADRISILIGDGAVGDLVPVIMAGAVASAD